MTKNAMIDIETLGVKRGSAPIIQIAAAKFGSEIEETFLRDVDLSSALEVSTVEAGTLKFWLHYSRKDLFADIAFSKQAVSLKQAFEDLIDFLPTGRDAAYWSQGMNFDFPIMESSMEKLGMKFPGQYYQQRDSRTMIESDCRLLGISKEELENLVPRSGTHHNALDDVTTQVNRMIYLRTTIKKAIDSSKPKKKK